MNRNPVRLATLLLASAPAALLAAQPAFSAPAPAPKFGDPITLGDGFSLDPMLDARLRWEDVDQPVKGLSADAVTLRARFGAELTNTPTHLSFLAEGEGTVGLGDGFNAFPYANASSQYRPAHAVVADPNSIELNRLQLAWRTKTASLTVGRQRINLDDERWVGSVGWRQNEQTFDAVRGTLAYGPLGLDVTYADSQRTIYGSNGAPRVAYDGKFWFLGATAKTGPVSTKLFAYLLNYDPTAFGFQTNSSQTIGFRSAGSIPLAPKVAVNFVGSYAHQADYGSNTIHYSADYLFVEAGLAVRNLTVKGGYEQLGSDPNATGGPHAVQTPMATFHKWDGWADQFLTTPAKGLVRQYAGVSYKFTEVKAIPGLNAQITYTDFSSDLGAVKYGYEWDGGIGFKTGPVTWLAKYANYAGRGAGTSTKKVWLQAEYSF